MANENQSSADQKHTEHSQETLSTSSNKGLDLSKLLTDHLKPNQDDPNHLHEMLKELDKKGQKIIPFGAKSFGIQRTQASQTQMFSYKAAAATLQYLQQQQTPGTQVDPEMFSQALHNQKIQQTINQTEATDELEQQAKQQTGKPKQETKKNKPTSVAKNWVKDKAVKSTSAAIATILGLSTCAGGGTDEAQKIAESPATTAITELTKEVEQTSNLDPKLLNATTAGQK